jgi:hypothetical protein
LGGRDAPLGQPMDSVLGVVAWFARVWVFPSGIVMPRDVGSMGVGLVHGLWFFRVAWFARVWVFPSGIVMPRDVGSMGVGWSTGSGSSGSRGSPGCGCSPPAS